MPWLSAISARFSTCIWAAFCSSRTFSPVPNSSLRWAFGRDVNRETLDTVLVVAAITMMFWAGPALSTADPDLVRMHATQFLLLSSAMIVILIERHIEESRTAEIPAVPGVLQPAASQGRSGNDAQPMHA